MILINNAVFYMPCLTRPQRFQRFRTHFFQRLFSRPSTGTHRVPNGFSRLTGNRQCTFSRERSHFCKQSWNIYRRLRDDFGGRVRYHVQCTTHEQLQKHNGYHICSIKMTGLNVRHQQLHKIKQSNHSTTLLTGRKVQHTTNQWCTSLIRV